MLFPGHHTCSFFLPLSIFYHSFSNFCFLEIILSCIPESMNDKVFFQLIKLRRKDNQEYETIFYKISKLAFSLPFWLFGSYYYHLLSWITLPQVACLLLIFNGVVVFGLWTSLWVNGHWTSTLMWWFAPSFLVAVYTYFQLLFVHTICRRSSWATLRWLIMVNTIYSLTHSHPISKRYIQYMPVARIWICCEKHLLGKLWWKSLKCDSWDLPGQL